MSFSSPHATLTPSGQPAHSGEFFTAELNALAQEIQRTREWFNKQLDSHLASLKKLCAATQAREPAASPPMANLFESAPPRLMQAGPRPPAVAQEPGTSPLFAHEPIILQPTLSATLDPELEQATLRELNNALARAFAEISARGGMIS